MKVLPPPVNRACGSTRSPKAAAGFAWDRAHPGGESWRPPSATFLVSGARYMGGGPRSKHVLPEIVFVGESCKPA